MSDLNSQGVRFATRLQAAQASLTAHTDSELRSQKVRVVGAGGTLTSVYEQLRNAAEYTEEHLLLQRAIRRFYRRLFLSRDRKQAASSGDELIIELTLAGYIKNNSVLTTTAQQISDRSLEFFDAQESLHGHDKWVVDVLAVQVESLITNHAYKDTFIQFSHEHFMGALNQQTIFEDSRPDFEVALFVAVHRALLHSDEATIRTMLLKRYGLSPAKDSALYRATNEKLDALFKTDEVEKLFRIVNRQGAPFRVLWRMIEDQPNTVEFLSSRTKFLRAYETQITHEYEQIYTRINKGIVKSVLFLIITKFLVGIAIEVPYDYLVHGSIVWLPLIVNLCFPPLYMLLLRTTLMTPGAANTNAMCDLMETYLYSPQTRTLAKRRSSGSFGAAYNVAYALFFLIVFGGVTLLLLSINFSFLHLFIFFVFLSTASFLGFRLSGMVRELEVVDTNQGGVTVVRDFLYMPFVVVGRWISEKYSKMNIVAMFLDMVIELPLKTVLRLVRQWSAFISSKKDEL